MWKALKAPWTGVARYASFRYSPSCLTKATQPAAASIDGLRKAPSENISTCRSRATWMREPPLHTCSACVSMAALTTKSDCLFHSRALQATGSSQSCAGSRPLAKILSKEAAILRNMGRKESCWSGTAPFKSLASTWQSTTQRKRRPSPPQQMSSGCTCNNGMINGEGSFFGGRVVLLACVDGCKGITGRLQCFETDSIVNFSHCIHSALFLQLFLVSRQMSPCDNTKVSSQKLCGPVRVNAIPCCFRFAAGRDFTPSHHRRLVARRASESGFSCWAAQW